MKRTPLRFSSVLFPFCVALTLALSACGSPHPDAVFDPLAAQQLSAAQADPDKALADKVKRALAADLEQGAYGIEVTATDGKVKLWGTAVSTAQRKRFELIAAGVVGVKGLENWMSVDPGL